ncbi:MAG: response regulator [Anaerolineae bacterium]
MPRILVIDDEGVIVDLVSVYLRNEGYEVFAESDGVAGLTAARRLKPDLIILDVMLPGLDGIELLRRIRQESDTYVIMLTARADEYDKIIGLSVGADDYLTKPFSPRELVARVKAALRRMQASAQSADRASLAFRHVRIDLGGRKVWIDDKPVDMTSTEFELLRVLAQHRGIVLSREQLLELVWGHDYFGEERVVDVHLGHVRQKLGMPDLIQTVRGVGFRFEDEPA